MNIDNGSTDRLTVEPNPRIGPTRKSRDLYAGRKAIEGSATFQMGFERADIGRPEHYVRLGSLNGR